MKTTCKYCSLIAGMLTMSVAIGCGKGDTRAHGKSDARVSASNNDASTNDASTALSNFSFFVTSLTALQQLSNSQSGFGGDLRFGETGAGAGLRGADKICSAIADMSSPGTSAKGWRAFLSATAGEDGQQVDAIDRVGQGPWYDRLGRLVAANLGDLTAARPTGADSTIVNDLPNEDGVPNHQPDPSQPQVDNHDVLTGTNAEGHLYSQTATCADWTSSSTDSSYGRPRVGHSWPRLGLDGLMGFAPGGDGGVPAGFPFGDGGFPPGFPGGFGDGGLPFPGGGPFGFAGNGLPPFSADGGPGMGRGWPPGFGDGAVPFIPGGNGSAGPGGGIDVMQNWMSSLDEAGCGAGVNLIETGPPDTRNPTVGSGGGYGAFYCFALSP
jgi:hypothetical protein